MRVLKDRTAAEDVVQETFLELWRRAPAFDVDRGSAAAWVVTIARSRALDSVRGSAGMARIHAAAVVEYQPQEVASLDEMYDQQRIFERLRRALDALPPKQRAAIQLTY